MKKRLEYRDDSSDKFWEIDVNGAAFTVHFCRLGTAGQSKSKSFATPAEAVKAADKLLAEKLGKGYREIEAETATPAPLDHRARRQGRPRAHPKDTYLTVP